MPATPLLPASAEAAYAEQAHLAAAAVLAVRRSRSKDPAALATIIAAYQLAAATLAADAVEDILAEQAIPAPLVAGLALQSLAGFASNGLPLVDVLEIVDPANLARFVATMVQDAGRMGGTLGMAVRPSVDGYVRMLNPPSCARCVVQAGRFIKASVPFERHPLCDCRHIPTSEAVAGDLTVDANAYFDSLPTAAEVSERYPDLTRAMRREAGIYSQEDVFGVAGAQAIREGADISQLVNARAGMSAAQVFGRDALITTSGTTRRGAFGRLNELRRKAGKSNLRYRLMPETIFAEAGDDRDEAIRLLRLYGWIL